MVESGLRENNFIAVVVQNRRVVLPVKPIGFPNQLPVGGSLGNRGVNAAERVQHEKVLSIAVRSEIVVPSARLEFEFNPDQDLLSFLLPEIKPVFGVVGVEFQQDRIVAFRFGACVFHKFLRLILYQTQLLHMLGL